MFLILPVFSDVVSSSERSVKSGRSIDVYLPTPTVEDSFENEESHSCLGTPTKSETNNQTGLSKKTVAIPGFPSIDSAPLDEDTGKSSFQYSDQFDTSKLLESTGELPQYSQSSYERSADLQLDSSKESHSSKSITSDKSSRPDDTNSPLSEKTPGQQQQPVEPGRLHTGFAMPKPLLSTKSPVPLAVRRSSRPSLQIQIPTNAQEAQVEKQSPPVTPPTPKPRLHLRQGASSIRSSSSQHGENFSTSEFSSNDSEGHNGRAKSQSSKKDYSTEGYSDEFDSSDSN